MEETTQQIIQIAGPGIDWILLHSAGLKIAYAMAALFFVTLFLRLLDKSLGVKFSAVWAEISTDPLAAADYMGKRFIGACILVGLLLS